MKPTRLHHLALMLDAVQELRAVERDIRWACAGWQNALTARKHTPEGVAASVREAGLNYRNRLAKFRQLRSSAHWSAVSNMWRIFGGTEADMVDVAEGLERQALELSTAKAMDVESRLARILAEPFVNF